MRHKRKDWGLPQRNKHKIRIAVIIIIALIFVGVFFLTRQSKWNGVSRITLVLQNLDSTEVDLHYPLAIFSIEPRTSSAVYVIFPGNTLLDVPYGYNSYPAATVYKLGELDSKRGGGRLLQKSIESTFGLAIDGYFVGKKGQFPYLAQTIEQIRQVKYSFFSILGITLRLSEAISIFQNTDSNLSFLEKARLFLAIRGVRLDQIEYFNLTDRQILDDQIQPDGSVVKTIDRDLFDLKVSGNFQDTLIRSENITVEVVNASGVELVATQFGKILTHMGANVVAKSTADKLLQDSNNCLLYLADRSFITRTVVVKLGSLYNCTVSQNYPESRDADIVVVLGKEFVR